MLGGRPSEALGGKMLFVFDLDGTLLNSKKEISESNKNAVQKLYLAGHKIVIATARPPRSIDSKIKKLGVPTDNIYYNGALVRCFDGITFSHFIEKDVFKEVFYYIKENDKSAVVSIEDNDTWFSSSDFDFKDFYSVKNGPEIITEAMLLQKNPNKILINSYSDLNYLVEKFNNICNVIETDSKTLIQIMDKNASKEKSIDEISKKYKISSNDIYCFGDDYNDIEMFKFCKNAVAMGNAISELKIIAKFVTETNDNDGVAQFLIKKGIIT